MIDIKVGRCSCGEREAVVCEQVMAAKEDGTTRMVWAVSVVCPECGAERTVHAERMEDIRLRIETEATGGGTDDADLHGETDHQG